jgi:hypothetical protein
LTLGGTDFSSGIHAMLMFLLGYIVGMVLMAAIRDPNVKLDETLKEIQALRAELRTVRREVELDRNDEYDPETADYLYTPKK